MNECDIIMQLLKYIYCLFIISIAVSSVSGGNDVSLSENRMVSLSGHHAGMMHSLSVGN